MPQHGVTRQMAWLIFAIGLLNLCLGYAMAVYLGYGPPRPWESWDESPAADALSDRVVAVERPIDAVCEESVLQPDPPQAEEEPEPAGEPAVSLMDE